MKEDYIKLALLNAIQQTRFVKKTWSWVPRTQLNATFQAALFEVFAEAGIDIGNRYADIVEKICLELIEYGAIELEGDEFTGMYFRLSEGLRNNFFSMFNDHNEVARRVSRLGGNSLTRALESIARADGLMVSADENGREESTRDVQYPSEDVPASDRRVTLNHNEMVQFEEQTSEIIEAIEKLNGIEGEPGLREVLIGQLKAGRELIRSGSFKVYALQWTLVEGLKFLASRYEKETIGALAGALLAILSKQLGLG